MRNPKDEECICHGNWRAIVKDYEADIGKKYRDEKGELWSFFGLVWGDDDFYYGMWHIADKRMVLHTCCGSLESFFDKVE